MCAGVSLLGMCLVCMTGLDIVREASTNERIHLFLTSAVLALFPSPHLISTPSPSNPRMTIWCYSACSPCLSDTMLPTSGPRVLPPPPPLSTSESRPRRLSTSGSERLRSSRLPRPSLPRLRPRLRSSRRLSTPRTKCLRV
ncbi:hypothetical protein AYX15_00245 [Cryptococcus neoformans]|nr:hypothetical protein AYX15_00245 [Cryptococcus neoformans var. grubii]